MSLLGQDIKMIKLKIFLIVANSVALIAILLRIHIDWGVILATRYVPLFYLIPAALLLCVNIGYIFMSGGIGHLSQKESENRDS